MDNKKKSEFKIFSFIYFSCVRPLTIFHGEFGSSKTSCPSGWEICT